MNHNHIIIVNNDGDDDESKGDKYSKVQEEGRKWTA